MNNLTRFEDPDYDPEEWEDEDFEDSEDRHHFQSGLAEGNGEVTMERDVEDLIAELVLSGRNVRQNLLEREAHEDEGMEVPFELVRRLLRANQLVLASEAVSTIRYLSVGGLEDRILAHELRDALRIQHEELGSPELQELTGGTLFGPEQWKRYEEIVIEASGLLSEQTENQTPFGFGGMVRNKQIEL